jgi:hypothetical protein
MRLTVGQSVCLSWGRAPSDAHYQCFFLLETYCPVHVGRDQWFLVKIFAASAYVLKNHIDQGDRFLCPKV